MKIMINHERGMFGLSSDQTLSSIDANQKTKNEALRIFDDIAIILNTVLTPLRKPVSKIRH